jgi:hypothetical protein
MRRLVLPPQALAKTIATEVQRHAARRSLMATFPPYSLGDPQPVPVGP